MEKKSKKGLGRFLVGIGVGAGLGLLFAPRSGKETRAMLKESFDNLAAKIKEIDVEEIKLQIEEKINEIKKDLEDLDKEKALNIAKKKTEEIKVKIEELAVLAKEKATPYVEDAVAGLKKSAIKVTKDVLTKLETSEKTPSKN